MGRAMAEQYLHYIVLCTINGNIMDATLISIMEMRTAHLCNLWY